MSAETNVIDVGRISRPAMVQVWDPLVRLFHWSLVGSFAFAFFTGDEWKGAHIVAGYIVGGLVAFRILWGIAGPKYARFASFIRGPMATLRYLRDALAFRAPRHLGHNPAGGAMILALLAANATIAGTGYMMTTDAYWGVEWVEELHKSMVYVTLGLIALHVGGVVLASIEHRENLVRSMFTGVKRRD
ncbi:cytochrome b/b6 domain-containing protein [Mesorhizobium sp. BAC0120]|uniref:cytochrome b/b6 domain-containing protein n=1 Tax=Mesorhizobium sp. BAC0120 TaxID=3090670 RepID=UPI00298CB15D|nr:cytochrome b/b6 domain-containing protein [Mesorhizobium sp. BAC0120]MDW6024786.1 cytochrome b/b6 domain-containing protein [Mesorhizobium sp. BAC0120]